MKVKNEEVAKVFNGLQMEVGDFTIQETERVTINVKQGKLTGPGNIQREILKKI